MMFKRLVRPVLPISAPLESVTNTDTPLERLVGDAEALAIRLREKAAQAAGMGDVVEAERLRAEAVGLERKRRETMASHEEAARTASALKTAVQSENERIRQHNAESLGERKAWQKELYGDRIAKARLHLLLAVLALALAILYLNLP